MDDFDIYADLSIPEEADNETTQELKKRISQLEQENISIKSERDKFEDTLGILQRNLSSLLKTAKQEISRKQRTIDELRSRLDSITFRRHERHQPKPKPVENGDYIHQEFEKVKAAQFSYPPPPIPAQPQNNVDLQEMVCSSSGDNFNEIPEEKPCVHTRKPKFGKDIYNNYSDDDEEEEEEIVRKPNYTTLYGERLKKRILDEDQKKREEAKQIKTEVSDKENSIGSKLLNLASQPSQPPKPEIKLTSASLNCNGIAVPNKNTHSGSVESLGVNGFASKVIANGMIAQPKCNGDSRHSRYDKYHSDSSEKSNRDRSKPRSPHRRSHHNQHQQHHRRDEKHSRTENSSSKSQKRRLTPRKHKTPKKSKKTKTPERPKLKVKTPKRKKRSYSKSPIKAKRRKVDSEETSSWSKTKDLEKSKARDKDSHVKPTSELKISSRKDNEVKLDREKLRIDSLKSQDGQKVQSEKIDKKDSHVKPASDLKISGKKDEEAKVKDEKMEIDSLPYNDKQVQNEKIVHKDSHVKPISEMKISDKKHEEAKVKDEKMEIDSLKPHDDKIVQKNSHVKPTTELKISDKKPEESKVEEKMEIDSLKPHNDKKVQNKKIVQKDSHVKPTSELKISDKKPEESKVEDEKKHSLREKLEIDSSKPHEDKKVQNQKSIHKDSHVKPTSELKISDKKVEDEKIILKDSHEKPSSKKPEESNVEDEKRHLLREKLGLISSKPQDDKKDKSEKIIPKDSHVKPSSELKVSSKKDEDEKRHLLKEKLDLISSKPQDDKKDRSEKSEVKKVAEEKSIDSAATAESKSTKEVSVDDKKCPSKEKPVQNIQQKEDPRERRKSSKNTEPREVKKVDEKISTRANNKAEEVTRDRKKYSLRDKEEKSYKRHHDDDKSSKEKEESKSRVSSRRSSSNLPREAAGVKLRDRKSTVVETRNTKRSNSNAAKQDASEKRKNLPREKEDKADANSTKTNNAKIQCKDDSMEEGEIADSDESPSPVKSNSLLYEALTSKTRSSNSSGIIQVSKEQSMSVNKTLTKHLPLVKSEESAKINGGDDKALNCRDKEILKKLLSEPLVRPTLVFNSNKDNKSQSIGGNSNEQAVKLETKETAPSKTPEISTLQEDIFNIMDQVEVEIAPVCLPSEVPIDEPPPAPLMSEVKQEHSEIIPPEVPPLTNGVTTSENTVEKSCTEVVKKNVIVIKVARRRRPVLSDSPAPKCYDLK